MIGPEDPPPYTIINGDGKASVLLVGDHASNVIPEILDNLGLHRTSLEQHIAYDIGSRRLLDHLSQHLDAPAVVAGYSRLVVDLNRNLEDSSAMPEVSDDTVIEGNLNMSPGHRKQRIECFYTPYRTAINDMLGGYKAKRIVPAFISIHTFTPEQSKAHSGEIGRASCRVSEDVMQGIGQYSCPAFSTLFGSYQVLSNLDRNMGQTCCFGMMIDGIVG